MKKVYLLKNRYVDSVTLMTIAVELSEKDGIVGAECGMGTKQNVDLLLELGYEVPADTSSNDVMIAVESDSDEAMRDSVAYVESRLSTGRSKKEKAYRSVSDLEEGEFDIWVGKDCYTNDKITVTVE